MPTDEAREEGTRRERTRRVLPARFLRFVPGLAWLAERFSRVAARRVGRVRVGLIVLLPVAILIDAFDAADELFGGPIGVALAWFVETAFVLGVTGRASWALGGGAWDLVPGLDLVPVATLTLLAEFVRDLAGGDADARYEPTGPVIDV